MTASHLSMTRPAGLRPAGDARRRGQAVAAAGVLAVAGAIHVVAGFDHLPEYMPFAAAFFGMAAFQLLAAAALARGTATDALRGAIVGLSVAIAALWAVSRLVGLPIGPEPWQPEAVGVQDAVCTVAELLAAVLTLRTGRAAARPH